MPCYLIVIIILLLNDQIFIIKPLHQLSYLPLPSVLPLFSPFYSYFQIIMVCNTSVLPLDQDRLYWTQTIFDCFIVFPTSACHLGSKNSFRYFCYTVYIGIIEMSTKCCYLVFFLICTQQNRNYSCVIRGC